MDMCMSSIWKELNSLSDWEEYQETEMLIVEDYMKDPSAILTEMACVRSMNMAVEQNLPFSFYFSSKEDVFNRHGIRLKVQWNPMKISSRNADGYFELHGDYEYISGSHKYYPTAKELKIARGFIRKYKVLFAASWEEKVQTEDVADWFEGKIKLDELLSRFENISEDDYFRINHSRTVEELEQAVRKYKIFNMND